MNKIDAFISCSRTDAKPAAAFCEELEKFNIVPCHPEKDGKAGSSFYTYTQMKDAIAGSSIFILFLTKNSAHGQASFHEVAMAFTCAIDRDKTIFFVVDSAETIGTASGLKHFLASQIKRNKAVAADDHSPEHFSNNFLADNFIEQNMIALNNDLTPESFSAAAKQISDQIAARQRKNLLLTRLSEYKKTNLRSGMAQCLSELILSECAKLPDTYQRFSEVRNIQQIEELYRYDTELERLCSGRHIIDQLSRSDANIILDAAKAIKKVAEDILYYCDHAYFVALGIRIIHNDTLIRYGCAYILTDCDTCEPCDTEVERYNQTQERFLQCLNERKSEHLLIPQEHRYFIRDTYSYTGMPKMPDRYSPYHPAVTEKKSDSRMTAIADYIRSANRLFDEISNEEESAELVKCLKTAYERLKNYCRLIGNDKLTAECIEKLSELRQRLEYQTEDSSSDADTASTKGIKTLLGLTLAASGNFDVFLSYKHEDIDLVRSLFDFLKGGLLEVFFDKETLPELSKSDYETAILESLDHSRHFVLVISDLKYLASKWIKLEYETFFHEVSEGRKEGSNIILVVTNEVYDEIIKTNKLCLPIQLRRCEIMQTSSYREKLRDYLR